MLTTKRRATARKERQGAAQGEREYTEFLLHCRNELPHVPIVLIGRKRLLRLAALFDEQATDVWPALRRLGKDNLATVKLVWREGMDEELYAIYSYDIPYQGKARTWKEHIYPAVAYQQERYGKE